MASSAALELRHMAALLEGMRALGSGNVLDEVLALVLDSAIEVTGAERGFIMLANPEKQLELKLVRARGKVTLGGRDVRDEPQDPRDRLRHRPAEDRRGSARRRSGVSAHGHGRSGHPPRLVRASCA